MLANFDGILLIQFNSAVPQNMVLTGLVLLNFVVGGNEHSLVHNFAVGGLGEVAVELEGLQQHLHVVHN